MSKHTRGLIASLKEATEETGRKIPFPQRFFEEVFQEMKRLGTQGSMELSSALFNGHGFVPYGPGQYTPDVKPQDLAGRAIGGDGQVQDQLRSL